LQTGKRFDRFRIISRIFRCLVIIGCNSGSTVLKTQIGKSVTTLSRDYEGRNFPPLLAKYLKAEDWNALEAAAYGSFDDCPIDKMVRLVLDDDPQATPSKSKLRFPNEAAFFRHFAASPLLTGTEISKLAANSEPFVLDHAQPPSAPEQSRSVIGIGKPTAEPLSTVSIEDLETPATTEEVLAVVAIEMAYKTLRWRRETNGKADERITRWHDQCLEVRSVLNAPRSYIKYFLGPLVHVLIWVESATQVLKRQKDAVKKDFTKAKHIFLEDLVDRLAARSAVYERIIELQKLLLPVSEVHQRGEFKELRKLVSELQTLTGGLELGDAEVHRNLGWKGIVKQRKVVFTKPVKPMLNTSDLLEG